MDDLTDLEGQELEAKFDKGRAEVGSIGNCYGKLNIAEVEGKFYWSIEDYSGFEVEEISGTLYQQLEAHKGNNNE